MHLISSIEQTDCLGLLNKKNLSQHNDDSKRFSGAFSFRAPKTSNVALLFIGKWMEDDSVGIEQLVSSQDRFEKTVYGVEHACTQLINSSKQWFGTNLFQLSITTFYQP